MRVEGSVWQAVRQDWTALNSAGEAAACLVAPSAVLSAQRTHADGATGLQPVVPLVRGPEHGRRHLGCDGVHEERQRLLEGDVADAFFAAVLNLARLQDLLSDEHFTVDGTLLEAWAGQKSFRRVDDEHQPPAVRSDEGSNPTVNFHGEQRSNQTHCSTADPDAMLARKSRGAGAVLAYRGHLLTENRNGLVVSTLTTRAYGSAERDAALLMAEALPGTNRVTLGTDKGYDAHDFVAELRHMEITPHIAQNDTNRRSAVDDRTTRHVGYQLSQKKRKRIEEVFGWMKSIGLLRKLRHRGLERVGWMFTFTAAAYNLVRIRNLMRGAPQPQCA